MPKCIWNIKSGVSDTARNLSKQIGLSAVVTQVLINRGFDSKEKVTSFLKPGLMDLPDPFLLTDMEKAANRVADAIQKKQRICVYGDYDIDGTTAIVTLLSFFRELNLSATYYQPQRSEQGYGLHVQSVQEIIDKGVDLIITVDCGTTSYETAKFCKEKNIDLIITDHHKVSNPYPESYAFINPHKPTDQEMFKVLAGVGVAYYLTIAVRKVLREQGFFNKQNGITEPNLKNLLDVVAFGTIADVVPLTGINRILVSHGMNIINTISRIGFSALQKVSGLKEKNINTETVGYILAPRLNAAGRMGSASKAVDLLLASNEEEAKSLAGLMHEENQKRMSFQNDAWTEVNSIIEELIQSSGKLNFENKRALVFASQNWHQGIIGIVAAKLSEKWFKPTAVYSIGTNGLARGSARSIPGVDIYSIFSSFKEIFEDFGGHCAAAGMSIKAEKIPEFEILFEKAVSQIQDLNTKSSLDVEVEVGINDLGIKTVQELSYLEPFGYSNPAPLFFTNTKILNKWILKDKHLKLRLNNGVEAIGFNMAEDAERIGNTANIVFKPTLNEWNGRRSLQFTLIDIE